MDSDGDQPEHTGTASSLQNAGTNDIPPNAESDGKGAPATNPDPQSTPGTSDTSDVEDFSDIKRYNVLSAGGTDRQGRPVVCFVRLPTFCLLHEPARCTRVSARSSKIRRHQLHSWQCHGEAVRAHYRVCTGAMATIAAQRDMPMPRCNRA